MNALAYRSPLASALVIARRELRDSLRDWRIVTPIALLTLGFPWLTLAGAQLAFNFTRGFDPQATFITIVPFSLMIVGFFPISFCLIIALEAFVGEKERNSLEPLLAMPISDLELYFGKLLASLVLPLAASFAGMAEFVVGLKVVRGMDVPSLLFVQIALLTTLKGLVMVSGAVVISSHTTSVRAANLLASFIIIPMTILVQGESVLLLNNRADILWHIMAALVVANLIVGRMGIRLFNREEILARETDELHLRGILATFWRFFREGRSRFSVRRFYRNDLAAVLARNAAGLGVTLLVVAASLALGVLAADAYPLPRGILPLDTFDPVEFRRRLAEAPSFGVFPPPRVDAIFLNNTRVIAAAGLMGLFSFGSLALILLIPNVGIIGYLVAAVSRSGLDPWQFVAAFLLPHGILELPAVVLGIAFSLQAGAALISPRPGMTAGDSLLSALADLVRIVVFIVLPALLLAAWIETYVTPEVIIWAYGR